MTVRIHRIYDDGSPKGFRALVDRLWPRGIAKQEADLDAHWKQFAPSDDLRQWFDHDPDKWSEFRKKYLHELSGKKEEIKSEVSSVTKDIVLLYGTKDATHNHAHILKEYIKKLR